MRRTYLRATCTILAFLALAISLSSQLLDLDCAISNPIHCQTVLADAGNPAVDLPWQSMPDLDLQSAPERPSSQPRGPVLPNQTARFRPVAPDPQSVPCLCKRPPPSAS